MHFFIASLISFGLHTVISHHLENTLNAFLDESKLIKLNFIALERGCIQIRNLLLVLVEGTKQTPIEAKLIKDGKVLPLKDVDVVIGEDKITFKIKKPARELSGSHQIKLSNGQGEDVKDVNIIMQDVPSAPQDVNVTEVFQTSCLVSWKPSKDDGGSPLIHYVVERQDYSLKGIQFTHNTSKFLVVIIFYHIQLVGRALAKLFQALQLNLKLKD